MATPGDLLGEDLVPTAHYTLDDDDDMKPSYAVARIPVKSAELPPKGRHHDSARQLEEVRRQDPSLSRQPTKSAPQMNLSKTISAQDVRRKTSTFRPDGCHSRRVGTRSPSPPVAKPPEPAPIVTEVDLDALSPLQRLRIREKLVGPRDDGRRLGGRIRFIADNPSVAVDRRKEARDAVKEAIRTGVPVLPKQHIRRPEGSLGRPRSMPAMQVTPLKRLGARERMQIGDARIASKIIEGSRIRALTANPGSTRPLTTDEALGLPTYDEYGQRAPKDAFSPSIKQDTAQDQGRIALNVARDYYGKWRVPEGEGNDREAILDLAVNELDAEQREQYARNHATVLREADWEKYKHIVDAFRDFTFGDFSPLGGIADATASPGKYDGVTWDDDSKTPNKYRIDRGLYGGVACGVGQDLVSIDPFKSEAGLLSQSHPDLMGVAAASTLNSGGEYSGSVFTEATSVTKPTVVPARKSSRATMKSTASPGIDQDLSVVVQEDSEKRSNKSAVSDVPTHGVLSRKKSAAVVAASGVTPASPQRDVGMIAQSHPSKQSVPEVSKTTEINAESRNDSQGKRHSKSGLGSKAQAMLASGAAIVGFGADGFVTLGLHMDIFSKFRTEDTSMMDSLVGHAKRALLIWLSTGRHVKLVGSAEELRRRWQVPERVTNTLHKLFRTMVLDVKGMSKATWKLFKSLNGDRHNDGCLPYWILTKELNLPICRLHSIVFDRILAGTNDGRGHSRPQLPPREFDHLDFSKYELGARDNARGRTGNAVTSEAKVDDDDMTSLGLGSLRSEEYDDGDVGKRPTIVPKRKNPLHRLIEDPELAQRHLLSFDEFYFLVISICNMYKVEMLRFAFDCFDKDGSGVLDKEERKALLNAMDSQRTLVDGNTRIAKDVAEFNKATTRDLDFYEFVNLSRRFPSMFYPIFALHSKFQDILGLDEMWLMEHRRKFLDEYKHSHAGADAPYGSWSRTYPHLAATAPGACLAIRKTCCRAATLLPVMQPAKKGRDDIPVLDLSIASPAKSQPSVQSIDDLPIEAKTAAIKKAKYLSRALELARHAAKKSRAASRDSKSASVRGSGRAGESPTKRRVAPEIALITSDPNMPWVSKQSPQAPALVTTHDSSDAGKVWEQAAVVEAPPVAVEARGSKELRRPVMPRHKPNRHFQDHGLAFTGTAPQVGAGQSLEDQLKIVRPGAATTGQRADAPSLASALGIGVSDGKVRPPEACKIRSLDQVQFTPALPRLARSQGVLSPSRKY